MAHRTGPGVVRDGPRKAAAGVRAGAPVCALTLVLILSLTACGKLLGTDDADTSSQVKGDDVTIGLLLPEKEATRYEKFDRPVIEQQVKALTHGKGTVLYANAGQHADKQKAQLDRMIADHKVDTVLIDAVDAKAIGPDIKEAKEAGIHVIAYDRLAEGPVDGYVTFDSDLVGQVQGQALLAALGGKPGAADTSGTAKKIVMMNGAPTDPNAALFKKGVLANCRTR